MTGVLGPVPPGVDSVIRAIPVPPLNEPERIVGAEA